MNTRNEKLLFAAIADDDTGASDLAGMLKEQDVETLLVIDLLNGKGRFLTPAQVAELNTVFRS
jgi:uncharacterized protein YgbK (DUF1537 family)